MLKERFAAMMADARRDYLPIGAGLKGDKAVEAVLEHFRDKDARESFYGFFGEMEELHEIISPDAFMRPFLTDFATLAEMCAVLRSSYDRALVVDKSLLRKTALLVQQNTHTSGISAPTPLQRLNAETLEAIAEQDTPDTVKVFNLLKAINQIANANAGQEPYLLNIGDKAEQVAQLFETRQETTANTLKSLLELVAQAKQARQERDATQLSPESFAVYWLLKHDGVAQADAVARQAEQAFAAYPHWQTSSHQEQELRRSFYKALISAGIDGVVDVAQRILNMLRRAQQ